VRGAPGAPQLPDLHPANMRGVVRLGVVVALRWTFLVTRASSAMLVHTAASPDYTADGPFSVQQSQHYSFAADACLRKQLCGDTQQQKLTLTGRALTKI
jgi:hypothetical protein